MAAQEFFVILGPWLSHGYTNTAVAAGPASCELTGKCQFYLANGLALSTHQVYCSAQCHFLEFCSQDIPSDLGSLSPTC